jgi:uncharacterized lipoprotein YajG
MRIAFPAVTILVLALAACGQSDTTTVSTPDGTVTATSSDNGSTTTITGTDGATATIASGPNAKIDLPDSMPLYPGAKVTTSISGGNASQKTVSVAFETNAAVEQVIAFYKDKAAALGLMETLNANDSGSMTFMAVKDQTMVQVIASKGTEGTEAQITWASPAGG